MNIQQESKDLLNLYNVIINLIYDKDKKIYRPILKLNLGPGINLYAKENDFTLENYHHMKQTIIENTGEKDKREFLIKCKAQFYQKNFNNEIKHYCQIITKEKNYDILIPKRNHILDLLKIYIEQKRIKFNKWLILE